MKLLLSILILFSMVGMDNMYRNTDWNIEIDLAKTNFSIETEMDSDTILKSGFCKLILPEMNCKVENVTFNPEIRLLDKYLLDTLLDHNQIFNTLHDYLNHESEVLSSAMQPNDLGQLFQFVVQKENRYLFYYHLIKVNKKNILIECLQTFGTKKHIDLELEKLIKGVSQIKN